MIYKERSTNISNHLSAVYSIILLYPISSNMLEPQAIKKPITLQNTSSSIKLKHVYVTCCLTSQYVRKILRNMLRNWKLNFYGLLDQNFVQAGYSSSHPSNSINVPND